MSAVYGTLCWYCKTCPWCPWFQHHRPVPGWTAVRRDVKFQKGTGKPGKFTNTPEESYMVIACPEFQQEIKRKETVRWEGEYYDAPCCQDCWSRSICLRTHGTCNTRERDYT